MPEAPSRSPDREDPNWEPSDVLVKVYVSRSVSTAINGFADALDLSRSLLVREALRRGLPAVVNDVRFLQGIGYQPSTHLAGMVLEGSRRGSRAVPSSVPRWAVTPSAPRGRSAPASPSTEEDVS